MAPLLHIDGVIAALTRIVADSKQRGDRNGYFAALYRKVTIRVKEGIAAGQFEDGLRMEQLDIRFAQRYLDAYEAYQSKAPCSKCWEIAFTSTNHERLTVLQYLLLGINAHINLDLGIAAAETMNNQELEALHHDFDAINAVLAELVEVSRKI